jgi:hypothetical protein
MSYLTGNNNISLGYSSLTGITSGTTGTITTPLVYNDYITNFNPCGEITLPNSFNTLNFNSNNMAQLKQSKIVIFEVTRDKKTNEITSSKFLKELWVEVKPGISLDLVAAKHLHSEYNPENIVVREIQSLYF